MDLSLSRRLLLSLVPLLALPLGFLQALIGDNLAFTFAFGAYFLLVGYCVLAPLATGPRIALRVLLLAIVPLGLAFLLLPLSPLNTNWGVGFYVQTILVLTLYTTLIAVVTALAAPLRTRPRFWLSAMASGALLGLAVAYYAEEIFCIFCSIPTWLLWLMLVPFAALPVLLCLTMHYGRRADDPGLTVSRIPPVSRRFFLRSIATLVTLAVISAAMLVASDTYNDRASDAYNELSGEVFAREDQLRLVQEPEAYEDAEAELAAAKARLEESQRTLEKAGVIEQLALLSLLPLLATLFWNLFWPAVARRPASD